MNSLLGGSYAGPGAEGGSPQERGHSSSPRAAPQSANTVIPSEWGRAGAGSKTVLEPATTALHTQAGPRMPCLQRAGPPHQRPCGREHSLTEARDTERKQGLPTLLPQSSHPRGWEPSPSGPVEDQIHGRVCTHGPLISQARQAQAGLRVMKEPPASDSSLLSSGCGR